MPAESEGSAGILYCVKRKKLCGQRAQPNAYKNPPDAFVRRVCSILNETTVGAD